MFDSFVLLCAMVMVVVDNRRHSVAVGNCRARRLMSPPAVSLRPHRQMSRRQAHPRRL